MMGTFWFIFTGFVLALILVAIRRGYAEFPGQKPEHYESHSPTFDMRAHLNGAMICEGVIFGPLGRVTSSFVADFDVIWDGDTAVINEHFVYNDGSIQDRQWQISMGANNSFTATAGDVPGQTEGTIRGSTLSMIYPIKLPDDAGGHVLNAKDWMYLTASGTIMNRSQFRKFGFRVAELVATIRPKDKI